MIKRTCGIDELRRSGGDLIDRVRLIDERLIVTKNGKPAVAVISIGELERLDAAELNAKTMKIGSTMNDELNEDDEYQLIKLISKHVLMINDIEESVIIQVWHEPGHADGYDYFFECSHHIHTPVQGGPYITNRPYNTSESSALRQAINGIMSYYKEAKIAGYVPSVSWLIPNSLFNKT